jgi:hypothetical protein
MLKRVVADDTLVAEATKLGGHKTKREAASAALKEYISYKKRIGIIDMFGKVDIEQIRKNMPPKGGR